jgi:hypothetical protein
VKAEAISDYRTQNGPSNRSMTSRTSRDRSPKTLEDIRKGVSIIYATAAIRPAATTAAPSQAAAPTRQRL